MILKRTKLINNKKIIKYLTAFTGIFYIIYYMWFRFIRERIPRDIPFELTILSFICLFIICNTYLYMIFRYFKPKTPHPLILSLITYTSKILIPLYIIDGLCKNNKSVLHIYEKGLHLLVKNVNKQTIEYPINNPNNIFPKNKQNFYIRFRIFPQIFLVIILMWDIFYFHRLDYFYTCILIGLYNLFWRYMIYSAENTLEENIQFLEKRYVVYGIPINEPFDDETNIFCEQDNYYCEQDYDIPGEYPQIYRQLTNVRHFVQVQMMGICYEDTIYTYDCIEKIEARNEYMLKHNIKVPSESLILWSEPKPGSDDISKELAKYFHKRISFVIDLKIFLENSKIIYNKIIPKLNLLIIMGYLISWSYILIVSLHTLNILDIIELLENTYKYVDVPF